MALRQTLADHAGGQSGGRRAADPDRLRKLVHGAPLGGKAAQCFQLVGGDRAKPGADLVREWHLEGALETGLKFENPLDHLRDPDSRYVARSIA
jgi:hypothetical protein